MSMSVPKLMILSHVSPGEQGVGHLWMRDICRLYPHHQLVYVYKNAAGIEWPIDLSKIASYPVDFPDEQGWFKRIGRFARHIRWAYEFGVNFRAIPSLIERIIDFGKRHQVECILVPMHGPTLLKIALPVAQALGVPLITLVWDPAEYILTGYRLDPFTYRRLIGKFEATLRASKTIGVMSERMQSEYEQRFDVPAVILHQAVERSLWKTAADSSKLDPQTATKPLLIGFSGTLYSQTEMKALIDALSSVEWCVAGRPVKLRFLGAKLNVEASCPVMIEYLGWRPMAETIELLSEVDIAYLPYRFHPDFVTAARLSFPTKFSTYLAANAPIFYHGPADSAVVDFLKIYPCGIGCHSLDATEILKSLSKLESAPVTYRQAGRAALEDELNSEIFRQHLANLFGIEVDSLVVAKNKELV